MTNYDRWLEQPYQDSVEDEVATQAEEELLNDEDYAVEFLQDLSPGLCLILVNILRDRFPTFRKLLAVSDAKYIESRTTELYWKAQD